jgi:NADH-quinone oxidoreductase subunit M
MNWFHEWGLTLAIFLPAVGLGLVLLVPKAEESTAKVVALLTSLVTLAVGIGILAEFDYDRAGRLQFRVNESWIDVINSKYHLGVDGISLPLLILSMVITVLVIVYSWNHWPEPHNPKAFLALILLLEVGMNGTFLAQDLILFFIFFEIVLLPMFFMIGVWGGPNREYASIKFFLFTLFGSALMLLGFLALYFLLDSFQIPVLAAKGDGGLANTTRLLIFGGLFLGFAIKVPMFPFHTWLPDAHTEAPTQGSVLLAAILLKLGTYGFVRIALPILPQSAAEFAPYIGLLAVIGIIYGAWCCLAQTDMKRLIAFSSVAHMGFVMLGIATLTDYGLNAALFGMVAHGLITGMLFFVAGSVKERYHTLEIRRLSGMLQQIPHLGWILGFCAMASLGLPGLAGFWGEFPAILSAYSPAQGNSVLGIEALPVETFRTYMVIAAIGTVFAAAYLLWLYQRTAFGNPTPEFAGLGLDGAHDAGHGGHGHGSHGHGDPAPASAGAAANADPHAEHEPIRDVNIFEWIAWTPLLIGIVFFGVYPNALFKVFDPGVRLISETFGG